MDDALSRLHVVIEARTSAEQTSQAAIEPPATAAFSAPARPPRPSHQDLIAWLSTMTQGGGNLFWARRGPFVLLVQGSKDPTSGEWDSFLDGTTAAMAENAGRCRVIVFTAGGKPDAEQRARSLERGWRDNVASPVVVVTSDPLARGVITIFSWFGMNIRAFTNRQLEQAYDRLQLTEAELRWLSVERRILEERLKLSEAV
jgi:hypothetical protein